MPTEQQYRQCADEGLTVAETAVRLGIREESVYRRARKLGLGGLAPHKRSAARRALDDLYRTSCANGLTIADMVELLHVKRNTVVTRARALELVFTGSVRRRTDWPGAADYLSCYLQDLTTAETATQLSVSSETVRQWGYKLKVVFKRNSGKRRRPRRCSPRGCKDFDECKARVASGEAALCESDIAILDQPEEHLWSRNGGDQAMANYYDAP